MPELSRFRSARTPSSQGFRQPAPAGQQRWNATSIDQALIAHENGDFTESAALVDAMGRDDRISAGINTRGNSLVSTNDDFSIVPPAGGSRELAEAVAGWWPRVVTDTAIKKIDAQMVMLGVSLSRIHWKRTAREWLPVALEQWHGQNFTWDERLGVYLAHTDQGGQVPVMPQDPNWLLVEPDGSRSWMAGSVRALGLAYVMRQFNWRDWARFNERHGLPILTIREPASNQYAAQKRAFYSGVRNMGSTGIIRLPQGDGDEGGFSLEMIEAKDRGHETFRNFRTDLDIAIVVHLLGQNLTTESGAVGSNALGRVQDRIRRDYRGADINTLSTSTREQLIVRWGAFNFSNFRPEEAPVPHWENKDVQDIKQRAQTFDSGARAIDTLSKTPVRTMVDYGAMMDELGIPQLPNSRPDPDATSTSPAPNPDDDRERVPPPPEEQDNRAHYRPRAEAEVDDIEALRDGQQYIDDLVADSINEASPHYRELANQLLEIVDTSESYGEIEQRILAAYQDAEWPADAQEIMMKTLVLSALAGRTSAALDEEETEEAPET